MDELDAVRNIFPQSITILPTYRCSAACRECCFESNPGITHRLSLDKSCAAIDSAVAAFPALQLLVLSGGEVFLLKDDLYAIIHHARVKGLQVRCVTNAFWGKSLEFALRTAQRLNESGVSEINISTGSDHQEFVKFSAVENAAVALVGAGIKTLITVEKDSTETGCLEQVRKSPGIRLLLEQTPNLLSIQCNSWMPFHEGYVQRGVAPGLCSLNEGCKQILNNVVVTPYNKLAACCGLTFEHIPELTLGSLEDDGADMGAIFNEAMGDFLKIWIHLDGPATIIRKLFGHQIDNELREIRHICQACAVLHLHPRIRAVLRARHAEFVPDVMARFALKMYLLQRESRIGRASNFVLP